MERVLEERCTNQPRIVAKLCNADDGVFIRKTGKCILLDIAVDRLQQRIPLLGKPAADTNDLRLSGVAGAESAQGDL